jgi:hypothetical protein
MRRRTLKARKKRERSTEDLQGSETTPRKKQRKTGLPSAFMPARISYIDRPPASRWTNSPVDEGKSPFEFNKAWKMHEGEL